MRSETPVIGLPQPKRMSLSESVADTIAEAIAMRILSPGERIVEMTLVDKLGVSRMPIREALKVLQAQGILTGGGHRGYRVATFDSGATQQIMEVRLSLESFLLRDAIENWRRGIGSADALDAPIKNMISSAKVADVRSSLIADLEFHRTIRLAARNAIVGTLWDTIARHVLIVFNFDKFRDEDLDAVPRQHEQFRDWIVAQVEKPKTRIEDVEAALEGHILLIARTKRASASMSV